jgi:hypothetical protein
MRASQRSFRQRSYRFALRLHGPLPMSGLYSWTDYGQIPIGRMIVLEKDAACKCLRVDLRQERSLLVTKRKSEDNSYVCSFN